MVLFRYNRLICCLTASLEPHLISSAHAQFLAACCSRQDGFLGNTRDFATWEDLNPGIVIKLGQIELLFFYTASQDLNLEVLELLD